MLNKLEIKTQAEKDGALEGIPDFERGRHE